MGQVIERRRTETEARINRIKEEVKDSAQLANGVACVYLTGSFARGESTEHSDLDLFIAGKGSKESPELSDLKEICIKADLIYATKNLGIPEFSGDGQYLVHYTIGELIESLGSPEDDATNTFTARMLLLLESRPLVGDDVYAKAIEDVIGSYWRDYTDHKGEFLPSFLCNDILRLWRTFCVNYEARTSDEPIEKKVKRKLKNFKLKHSRMLTCYSGIAYLLGVCAKSRSVTPQDAQAMVRMTPTDRLHWIGEQFPDSRKCVAAMLDSYERFLEKTSQGEQPLLKTFEDKAKAKELMQQANEFGEIMFDLLSIVGKDCRLYRHLVV